jgi:hypothetical protein
VPQNLDWPLQTEAVPLLIEPAPLAASDAAPTHLLSRDLLLARALNGFAAKGAECELSLQGH